MPNRPPSKRKSSAGSKNEKKKVHKVSRSNKKPNSKTSTASEGSDVGQGKQFYKLDGNGLPILTVGLTGATSGNILQGVGEDTKGVILKVESGHVQANSKVCGSLTFEELVAAYVRDYAVSRAVAEQQVRNRSMTAPTLDNAHPIGSSCPPGTGGIHTVHGDAKGCECDCVPLATFRIIEPGTWVNIADMFGNKEQLMKYWEESTILTWRQILQLCGNKRLMLRAKLFTVTTGPQVVASPSPEALDCTLLPEGPKVTYDVGVGEGESLEVTVDVGNEKAEPNSKVRAVELVAIACPRCSASKDTLERLYDTLQPLTVGALKSAMQKTVRFGATSVKIETCNGPWVVSSQDFAAMACCMLALNPGGFVPQIQHVVRGIVSALKRAVVTIVEDSYVGTPKQLQRLLGTALVCQRVRSFHPSSQIITTCIRLIWEAAGRDKLIDWRPHIESEGAFSSRHLPETVQEEFIVVQPEDAKAFNTIAVLLETLRSLKGDYDMMWAVARLANKTEHLPILRCRERPRIMPFCHIIDQHTQPGIGHVMLCSDLKSFQDRFHVLFGNVTGMNPRKDNVFDNFEGRSDVMLCRFAQQQVLKYMTRVPPTLLPTSKRQKQVYKVDPGTLAAGVGPVECSVKIGNRKRLSLLVVLPTIWDAKDADEVVMLQPTRSGAEDYLEWGNKDDPAELEYSEMERQEARQKVRSMVLKVASPLLPPGEAQFSDGAWHFNGRPWREWIKTGIQIGIDIHPSPMWPSTDVSSLLHDNAVIAQALNVAGSGMCIGAREAVIALCDALPSKTVNRAHGLLRQQFHHFSMPVPSRHGGLGSDQLQAYPGDWDVWRLLVLFSRLVPGALRPMMPPRFDVPNAVLLSMLSSWISGRRQDRQEICRHSHGMPSPWQQPLWTQAYNTATKILRQHQKDAVERMKHRYHRGAPGHYLVMDTGHGKTYTALTYAMWRLLTTDLGSQVERIIWITPPGKKLENSTARGCRSFQLIRSLMDEFETDEALVKVPVSFVDKKQRSIDRMFPKYKINICHHDHIRQMPDALVAVAPTSLIIFDEGDNFYGPTQRTSMALRLAALCPEFIIQTATPVPGKGNIERMAEWLGLTEEYPVTRQNYLVAACNMVSLKVSLGIKSEYLTHEVQLTQVAERAFQEYIQTRDWRKLFQELQNETNRALCERAHHYAVLDRTETDTGGCFVVCEGDSHVQALLTLFRTMYGDIKAGDSNAMNDPNVGVVFVSASNNRGYNEGVRLGVQIRQPYPGSGASRQQMEGRIRRMNQRRSLVTYEIVYMQGTLMQLLHDRQQKDDNVNHSLDQLAEEYDRSVIDFFCKNKV